MPDSLKTIAADLDQFAKDREWQQFHAPKNLACALAVEASELLEHFQWMPEADSRQISAEKLAAVTDEVADVLLYLVQFSTALGIDPVAAAQGKLKRNAERYPVDKVRGSSRKYDEL